MNINRKQNLVIKLGDDMPIYVHSMPISSECFKHYHRVIARAFTMIFGGGLDVIGGVSIASLTIHDAAVELGVWDDKGGIVGVKNGLMGEIRRLSNVIMFADGSWQQIPLDVAIKRELLDEESIEEVENKISFFILISRMLMGSERTGKLSQMCDLWDVLTTLSNSTEYLSSLPTLTAENNLTVAS